MSVDDFSYTAVQQRAIAAAGVTFLIGPAGTGKSTALQGRLLRLLQNGEPAYTILMLVAEPERRQEMLTAVHQSGLGPYADLKINNYNQLAMEMVGLFWPLVARDAGFARPYQPPTFLSYDLAQLLMWQIINPLLDEGAFADLRLRSQQIVSQLLDTLNRSALNGLTLDDAIQRQQATWSGEVERLVHLADAAQAARAFRHHCLQNSLLDLSLAVRVFDTQLVHHKVFKNYFRERYRHLLVDNIEEQTPAGQNFVRALMEDTASTAIAYDAGGGYKRFLAADPRGARQFRGQAAQVLEFTDPFVTTPPLQQISGMVGAYLPSPGEIPAPPALDRAPEAILARVDGRYRRELVFNLVDTLHELLETQDLQHADIAIIAPYLDGALRYMLTQALQAAQLPYFLLRRRFPPQDEPRVRAWLTWLALARPEWGLLPDSFDVAEALTLSINGLDPARAALLVKHLYAPVGGLLPAAECPPQIGDRVGGDWLNLYDQIRVWLLAQEPALPLDAFIHNLFNDLLSQPRFQPQPDVAGAAVCDWLVRAATRLRQAAAPLGLDTPAALGIAFLSGIQQGLVTADPPDLGDPPDPDGIMISTIYGYLLAGRPVRVQVWLETSALGWWDIPNQPLSNAFVLAQSYDPQRPWTMADDGIVRNELLTRIIRGLTARCSQGVVLATSDLDRRGVRQDGPLWRALQPIWS